MEIKRYIPFIIFLSIFSLLLGCAKQESRVVQGNRAQILHKGNGQEPEDLDPHIINGISEYNIISALLEGLVSEDPQTLQPIPGIAEYWEISDDRRVYTFYLRPDAKWSNGDSVTASDFAFSYRRILSPKLGSTYAYMLYPLQHAKSFHEGSITDFTQVGVKAINDQILQLTLTHPTPYFLSLLNHWTWLPVHPATILKFGKIHQRGTIWTRPKNFVGNGPFILDIWKVDQVIIVKRNEQYWDADTVRLNAIHFYPISNPTTEERAFRAGKLHITHQLAFNKIEVYQQQQPECLRIDPYLATYFYCINVNRPPLDNPKVRQALALAIDRKSIVENVLKGGQKPALYFTPPNTAGYTSETSMTPNLQKATQLLAEAGYPNGTGFPKIELLYNTSENHRTIAEAIQQMWKKNLHIDISLINQEWKVYINTRRQQDFDLCRFGWTGDYLDPNTFLDMWTSDGGNNAAGWSNVMYDKMIEHAAEISDPNLRFELFQKAENILLTELPIIPIYFYTTVYLTQPGVKNWHPTILDHHPYKYVYLEP